MDFRGQGRRPVNTQFRLFLFKLLSELKKIVECLHVLFEGKLSSVQFARTRVTG